MSPDSVDGRDPPSIAYLCSAYPAVSHTFVTREVLALRRCGVDVHTFSVRRAAPDGLLSPLDRAEASRTHHLLPTGPGRLASAFGRLLSSPRGFAALRTGLVEALRLRRPGLRSALWQIFYLVEAVLLWDECSHRRIRHVHAHFANVASDVALLTSALGTAVDPDRPWSFSWTMHGPSDLWNVDDRRLADKATRAGFVACISDFARSQLMVHTEPEVWARLHVVHCTVDVRDFASQAPSAIAEPDARPRLVNVARLAPVKGHLLLIDAVATLRDRGHEVTVEIIGDGPSRTDIERRVRTRGLEGVVTLSGALSVDEVRDRVATATAFVLPSFAEGVPVVLMEAMALRVPVIAPRVAGIPELVEDGVSGLLTTPGRVGELVAALERLLGDEALRGRLAAAGKRTVADAFDSDRQAQALARLFGVHEAVRP